jgi:hypothetical protein
MEHIYSAELINNQINWIGRKPKRLYKNRKYAIKIVLENEDNKKLTGKTLIDFFRNSPLFGVELDLTRSKDYGRDIDL